MLGRLSASHDAVKRQSTKGDRISVFGAKKQASFHVVISELRAELMNAKLASGQPCVLLWVRGETVHATEDSVGMTVLSWMDTYFSQLVTLQLASSGFKTKECKFKVQQKGKTVAKTAVLDLARYCSDTGQPREQAVALQLQPSGTLYFVISTTVATEQQQQQHQQRLAARNGAADAGFTKQLSRLSTNSLASTTISAATLAPQSGSMALFEPRQSTTGAGAGLGGARAAAGGGGGGAGVAPSEDGDRPSSARRTENHLRSSPTSIGSGLGVFLGGGGGGSASLNNSSKLPQPISDSANTSATGIFKRLTRGGGTKQGSTNGGGADLSPSPSLHQLPIVFRKLESTQGSSPTGGAASGGTARSVSLAGSTGPTAGSSSGGMPYSPAKRAIQSFTGGATRLGKSSSSSALNVPQVLALDNSTEGGVAGAGVGVGGALSALMRASIDSSSDVPDRGTPAGSAKGGSWGNWLRTWGGRSSDHSATSANQPTSFPGGGASAYGNAPEPQYSGSLEAAIRAANEVDELRNFALDLLHERDEWRSRALSAQDAFGRAQAARGSAARDAQRLELRVRQYQDELGRRTDGSLLQELVEAKVRIAELANENLRLRRQITHMGPLFYDLSGEVVAAGADVRN